MMTGLSVPDAENVLRRISARIASSILFARRREPRRERAAGADCFRTSRAFRYDENDRQQISMTQRNGKNTPIQGPVPTFSNAR